MRKIQHSLRIFHDEDMYSINLLFKVRGYLFHRSVSCTEEVPMFHMYRELIQSKHYLIELVDGLTEEQLIETINPTVRIVK